MTADPSEEPGRPKRRRRRRRRSTRGGNRQTDATRDDAGAPGSGSSDELPRTPDGDGDGDAAEPPTRSRRRRRRRRAPRSDASGTNTAHTANAERAGSNAGRTGSDARRGNAKGNGHAGRAAGAKAAASSEGRSRRSGRKKASAEPRRRFPTQKEVSAGGVVYRRTDEGALEIVLASRRTRRGDLAWGLAKGGIEDGETNEDAALREVREETGIVAEIEESLGETKYIYVWDDVRIRKTVHFFLMRATGGDPDDRDDEMEEIRWFPLERALKRAAYRGEREVLGRAAELLGS